MVQLSNTQIWAAANVDFTQDLEVALSQQGMQAKEAGTERHWERALEVYLRRHAQALQERASAGGRRTS